MIEIRAGEPPGIGLTLPHWLVQAAESDFATRELEARVAFVLGLAGRGMEEGGGPFAAAIFDMEDGHLFTAGVNLVVPGDSSLLHAEIVALLLAQARLGSRILGGRDVRLELVASCDPCAMCIGAIHWSGLASLVTSAAAADARSMGFDEGPVAEDAYEYVAARGMTIRRGVLREDGAALLKDYAQRGGPIYNG
jgi:tRNA(Arg) A34 adenosine deaminase TadA